MEPLVDCFCVVEKRRVKQLVDQMRQIRNHISIVWLSPPLFESQLPPIVPAVRHTLWFSSEEEACQFPFGLGRGGAEYLCRLNAVEEDP